jgi:acetyltransferase
MIVENQRIKECDINPLIVSDEGMIALDARFVLHEHELEDDQLPKLAIRPYPLEYIRQTKFNNGKPVTLRPIKPEDEPLIVKFHQALSEDTVRQRYFEFVSLDQRVAHDRLIRICFNDYDREWAIVAECDDQIVGIGRLYRLPNTSQAEFKMTIIDQFQKKGLGSQLLQHLIMIAKIENIQEIQASILVENEGMIKICTKYGFTLSKTQDPLIVNARWENFV